MSTITVPTSISRARVLDFVRSLGIDPDGAIELRVGVDRIELDVLARNEAGDYFAHPNGDFAKHTIAIDMHHDEADDRAIKPEGCRQPHRYRGRPASSPTSASCRSRSDSALQSALR